MSDRSPETERELHRLEKWTDEARRVLIFLRKSKSERDRAFAVGEDHEISQEEVKEQLVKEATYFLKLALRFSSDWPEFQDVAEKLQRLIDETRELIE
jgi:hypothetical protein